MKAIICDVCGSPITGVRRYKLKSIFNVAGYTHKGDICGQCWDDIENEIIKRRKKNEGNNR